MARETVYLVQGFSEKLGVLVGSTPVRCRSEEAALRSARRMGEEVAGAIAFSSSGDAELGDYDEEAVVLFRVGRVPDDFRQ